MAAQSPTELFGIDSLIDPDDRDMTSAVRTLLDAQVRPHLQDWYEAGTVPVKELAPKLGEMGLLGMHLEGYGLSLIHI